MRNSLILAVTCFLCIQIAQGQTSPAAQPPHAATGVTAAPDSDDLAEMRADVQQLKTLLNQMRTNLAFVQTSQTPLKHQFELEADAWQVVVDRMERRLKRMEEQKAPR